MRAHRHVVEKRAKIMTCDSVISDQSEQTCIAVKKLTANELPVPPGGGYLGKWRVRVCADLKGAFFGANFDYYFRYTGLLEG